MNRSKKGLNENRKLNRENNKKGSLQKKILIPFLTILLLSGVLISFVSFASSVTITTNELTENVEEQMVGMNETFEMFFQQTDNALERMALNDALTKFKVGKEKDLIQLFNETQTTNDTMTSVYLGLEKDGSILIYPEADLSDFNVKERPWYQDAVAAEGEVIWTEPFIDVVTNEAIVTGAKAIYHGKKLIGVIGIDVQVNTLFEIVNNITIGTKGYAMILDSEGTYVAHPEEEAIGKDESDEAFYQEIKTAGNRGLVEFKSDGKKTIMGFAKNPTTDWILGGVVYQSDLQSEAAMVLVPIGIVLVIVLAIAIFVSVFISRRITKPVNIVMERMQMIADGDLTHRSLKVTSNDEVGQLTHATNHMQDQMSELLHRIHTVSETVTSQSEELTQSANEVKQGSEQVSSTMQELASAAELEANHTTGLASAMQDFAHGMKEASQNGEHIQETSNEVLEMTSEGRELMNTSKGQMERIDKIVQYAVQKMQGLDEQSQEISKLVAVIQGIAEQTNLLALNAAIEAARAGEHGQGFAVVADEVRKLAEQVSDSVTDITDIVTNIQNESTVVANSLQDGYKEVERGTTQIDVTSDKFTGINQAVIDMVSKVNATSEKLIQIAAHTHQMNNSIEEIAAVSEQSAAGIEETSASSQQISASMEEVSGSSSDLAKLAEELNGLVSRFKL